MTLDYSIYKPNDVFRAIGRHWVLKDEFNYPIDPNLRNSRRVHNTMRQEWAWFVQQQEMFHEELVGYQLSLVSASLTCNSNANRHYRWTS